VGGLGIAARSAGREPVRHKARGQTAADPVEGQVS
jgi:hypothetical protein